MGHSRRSLKHFFTPSESIFKDNLLFSSKASKLLKLISGIVNALCFISNVYKRQFLRAVENIISVHFFPSSFFTLYLLYRAKKEKKISNYTCCCLGAFLRPRRTQTAASCLTYSCVQNSIKKISSFIYRIVASRSTSRLVTCLG